MGQQITKETVEHDTLGRDKAPHAGEGECWPKLKLTTVQADMWEKTRTAVLWNQPAFSDIWYSMMPDKDGELAWFTDCIPIAATDDKILYLNPELFFKFTLEERIFVACHEVTHAMFNHQGLNFNLYKQGYIRYPDGVQLEYKKDLMNIAMDCVVNDLLVKAKVGVMPKDGWHLPDLITAEKHSVIDAYRILYKKGKNGSLDEKSGKGFDTHLNPGQGRGKPVNKAMSERNESAWDNAITAAMEAAKARGKLPFNLQRMFTSKIDPQADWREVYGLAVTRKIGNNCYSWEQLDAQLIDRDIGAPGRVQFGCNLLVIAIDSSGSTFQSTVDLFFAETRPIIETIRPKRIIITQCDAQIQEWREVDMYDINAKVKGGGGTDFRPVFERIQKEYEEPDLLIYLTDLKGKFPTRPPNYDVIWGYVGEQEQKAPWGEMVYIPQQAK